MADLVAQSVRLNLVEELRGLLKRAEDDWYLAPFKKPIEHAIAEIERLTKECEQLLLGQVVLSGELEELHKRESDRARSYTETYQRNSGGLRSPS